MNTNHGKKTTPLTYDGATERKAVERERAKYNPAYNQIRRLYHKVEGSLLWLHLQEPIAWPYNTYCLGTTDDETPGGKVMLEDTKLSMETAERAVEMFGRKELAKRLNISITMIHYWRKGQNRMSLKDYNRVKELIGDKGGVS